MNMGAVTEADVERIRSEAVKSLLKHEIDCAERYGKINETLCRLEALHMRNTRLLYVVLGGMLAVAGQSFWM